MAVDIFLKLQGIDGESQKKGYEKQIDILSFSFGAHQTGSYGSGGAGGGTGKGDFSDLSVVKNIDKASAPLFKFCASGKHIPTAKLVARKVSGDKQLEYYQVELTDCIVSGVQNSGASGGDLISESVSLNFAQIKFTYVPQKADMSADGQVQMGWDIAKAQAV